VCLLFLLRKVSQILVIIATELYTEQVLSFGVEWIGIIEQFSFSLFVSVCWSFSLTKREKEEEESKERVVRWRKNKSNNNGSQKFICNCKESFGSFVVMM